MIEPEIIEVDLDQLILANWNYKKDDQEKADKLKNSIKEDNSAGIPAVREIDQKTKDGRQIYEVGDGNHRLISLQDLAKEDPKWKRITVENFGRISKAKMILIARRRNYLWFEDDTIKFAELFRNHVLPEIDIPSMVDYMPETLEQLESYEKLLEFDWNQFNNTEDEEIDENWIMIKIKAPKQEVEIFNSEMERLKEIGKTNSDWVALKYMAINSSQTPTESLE